MAYGTALDANQLNAFTSVPGTFSYYPDAGAIPNAGTNTLSVVFVPDDLLNYSRVTNAVELVVVPALPTLTWTEPAAIFFGTALDASQLNATAPGVGTFSYTPDFGTLLDAGANQLSVHFSSSNSNYLDADASVQLTILPAAQSIEFSPVPNQVFGAAPVMLTATASSGLPVAFAAISGPATVNGNLLTITGVGAVTVQASQNGYGNYAAANEIRHTFLVQPATPMLNWTNPVTVVYGTALDTNQLNAVASVQGTFSYSPGLGTLLNSGTNLLSVVFVPEDSMDYGSVTNAVELVVLPALPTLTWAEPTPIVFGTVLDANQLNATAPGAGTFAYIPDFGAVLDAGANLLSVHFTSSSSNYLDADASIPLTILPTSQTIEFAGVPNQVFGAALVLLTATASSGLPVTFAVISGPATVNGSLLTVTGVGAVTVEASQAGSGNYAAATAITHNFLVQPATPLLSWTNPVTVVYGTVLDTNQLNAVASVPGNFSYSPDAGTILDSGTNLLSVVFVPDDSMDYSSVTNTVELVVLPTSPTLTWAEPTPIVFGTALDGNQLNATAPGVGTFAYIPDFGAVLDAGANLLSVHFTSSSSNYLDADASISLTILPAAQTIEFAGVPNQVFGAAPVLLTATSSSGLPVTFAVISGPATVNGSRLRITGVGAVTVQASQAGSGNYAAANEISHTFLVQPATPMLSWTNPMTVVYGTALDTNQLNAVASVPGTFNYSPDVGTILNSGTNLLSVVFVPDDSVNYSSITSVVSLVVSLAPLTITGNNATKTYGETISLSASGFTAQGLLNGDQVTNVTLTSPGASAAAIVSHVPYPIAPTMAQGSGLANYTISYQVGWLTVKPAPVVIVSGISARSKLYDGTTSASLVSNEVVLLGIISGDDASLNTNGYSANFASLVLGVGVRVNVSGLTLSGFSAGNYALAQPAGLTADITSPMAAQVPWGLTMTNGGRYVISGDSLTKMNRWPDYFVAFMATRYPSVTQHWRVIARSGEQLLNNYGSSADYMSWFDEYVAPARGSQVFLMMTPNGGVLGSNDFYTALQVVATNKIAGYAAGMSYNIGGFTGGTNTNPTARSSTNYAGGIPVFLGTSPLDTANGSPTQQQRSDAHTAVAMANGYPYFANLWRDLYIPFSNNYATSKGLGGLAEAIDLGWKDATHPGPAGFLCFAYAVLTNLNEGGPNGLVSTAMIDALQQKAVAVTNCAIGNLSSTATSVTFTRLDTRLPMPWDEGTYPLNGGDCSAGALTMFPGILTNLNRYMLYVSNLSAGTYTLSIDGGAVTNLTDSQLLAGVNMAAFKSGAIHAQLANVLNCVRDLQGVARTNDIAGVDAGMLTDSSGADSYGVVRFLNNCTVGWNLGLRDDGLVSYSNITAAENLMLTNSTNSDVALLAAAQPITRTFTLAPAVLAIAIQPASLSVSVGAGATLQAVTSDPGPLSYQWRVNGSNLSDAVGFSGSTSATLSIPAAAMADGGDYSVVVSNGSETATSSVTTLTVIGRPVISQQPLGQTVSVGGTASFAVSATGVAPLVYQWLFRGTNLPGATKSSLSIANAQANNAGNYQAVISNVYGLAISSTASLLVNTKPIIQLQPQSLNTNLGATVRFAVVANGTSPLFYQWKFNGTSLGEATDSSLMFTANLTNYAGNYSVIVTNGAGAVTSTSATLTLNVPPGITKQPIPAVVNAGVNATLIVGVSGTLPMAYQWQCGGTNLAGATKSTLSAGLAGDYQVIISNIAGTAVSSPARLTVNTKPVIINQPQGLVACLGSNVNFSVLASGNTPLGYQWKFYSTNLPGATQMNLSFNLTSPVQAGPYSVTITNMAGAITSSNATLVIATPPVITNPLLPHTNLVGTAITFSTTATGTTPLVYRWQLNGEPIPGGSTTALALSNILVANGGTYSVSVSNAAGVATSSAQLTVALDVSPPTVTITSPTAAQNLVSNLLTAVGTSTDNSQVTNLNYSLNGSAWQKPVTTNAWKNWSVVLDGRLIPGTNTLAIQAQDFSGNVSLPLTRSFFFRVPSLLTVRTNGLGTLSTKLDQQTLLVGQNYSVTALPAQGHVFTNWQVDAVLSANPALTFTMQTNLMLTANFVPSPYGAKVVGTYNGLFFETNVVAFPSAGLLSLTVDTNGGFVAKAYIEGVALTTASGLFDTSGHGELVVSRSAQHKTNLLLNLQLDLSGASQTITGLVSSVDGAWNSPYWGGRAIYGTTNTTPLAGKYAFAIPGSVDETMGPVGDGYGAVTLATNGVPTLLGNLGDATKQAQALTTVSITPQGFWPLYEPLYSGGGALIGWLAFSNAPGVITNLTGTVMWIKTANATNVIHPGGFTNQADVIGSGFVTPTSGHRILGLPVSQLVLAGANLPAPLTNSLTLSTANVVTVSPNPYSLKLTFTTASGLFTGSFINPVSGLTNLLNGAVLQNQNLGVGEFGATNSVGAILLR